MLDNKNVTLERCDIRELDPEGPFSRTRNLYFTLPALATLFPRSSVRLDYMDVNVQGTVRVLECARAAGVQKFVYAASSSCYGLAECPN